MDNTENNNEITKDSNLQREEIRKRGYALNLFRANNWDNYIDNESTIKEATAIVEIMEALNEGKDIQLVKEQYEKMNLGTVACYNVRYLTLLCSRRGPEFWKATCKSRLEWLKNSITIIRIERQNKKMIKRNQKELPPATTQEEGNSKKIPNTQDQNTASILAPDDVVVVLPSLPAGAAVGTKKEESSSAEITKKPFEKNDR